MSTEYETDTYMTECVHCDEPANWSELNERTDLPFGFIVDKHDNLWCEKCYYEERKQSSGRSNERHSSLSDYSHWNEEAPIIKAYEDRYADYYSEPNYDDNPYEGDDY